MDKNIALDPFIVVPKKRIRKIEGINKKTDENQNYERQKIFISLHLEPNKKNFLKKFQTESISDCVSFKAGSNFGRGLGEKTGGNGFNKLSLGAALEGSSFKEGITLEVTIGDAKVSVGLSCGVITGVSV